MKSAKSVVHLTGKALLFLMLLHRISIDTPTILYYNIDIPCNAR